MEIDNSAGNEGSVDLSSQTVVDPSTTSAVPDVLDVDDNRLIRLPGSDKPVKFGEHVKGFQSQATRANQERARIERELAQERAIRTRYEQEKQLAERQRQTQSQGPDVYEQLGQLPYLSGQDAVGMVKHIGQQLQQRDQILMGTLKELQKMQGIVQQLYGNHAQTQFDGKIDRVLTEGNYPPEAKDLAREIYLAYEGNDLDVEFPRIFAERWNQIERAITAKRDRLSSEARAKNRFVPGKGGVGAPSRPLDLKASASPKEIADMLFPLMDGTGT